MSTGSDEVVLLGGRGCPAAGEAKVPPSLLGRLGTEAGREGPWERLVAVRGRPDIWGTLLGRLAETVFRDALRMHAGSKEATGVRTRMQVTSDVQLGMFHCASWHV